MKKKNKKKNNFIYSIFKFPCGISGFIHDFVCEFNLGNQQRFWAVLKFL